VKKVLSVVILLSCVGSLFLFQNCARGFETISASELPATINGTTTAVIPEVETGAEFSCPDLIALKDSGRSAVTALQSCLASASEGASVLLPGGKYLIDSPVVINKAVTLATKNLTATDSACAATDTTRCATFMLSSAPQTTDVRGMIQITANKVNVDHIVVDGDRANPVRQIYSLCRNDATRGQGNNLALDGTDFVMTNSVTRNSPCSTGFEIHASALRFKFVNNFVGNNGAHNENMMWADGLTVHSSEDSLVDSNTFQNNTDVDLIFGGCQRCTIQNNKIVHTTSFAGSSFAALMLHSWDAAHGNYTGSVTKNNSIDCSYMRRCGFGILLGSQPWYDQPYFGGEVSGNSVNYAMAGLVINDATGSTKLLSNTVTGSGGTFASSCGDVNFAAFSISPTSAKYINTNQSGFTSVSYKGCIANWWTRDSATAQCDPVNQPAPHWGMKNGQCLKSCGALGGTRAFASACSANGMTDVGTAYDVPYCCK
jgi:hypothetical protein